MTTLLKSQRASGLRLAIAGTLVIALLGGYAPALASGNPAIVDATVRDADTAAPLADAEVEAWLIEESPSGPIYHLAGRSYTGAEGTCTVCDEYSMGAGRYLVEVYRNGYAYQQAEVIWNGADPVDVAFDLVAHKPIADATVKDAETGEPIQDAEVCAYFSDPVKGYIYSGSAYTGVDGTCTVFDEEVLGSGTYKIEVWAKGYEPQSVEVVWNGVMPQGVVFEMLLSDTEEACISGDDRIETAIEASKHAFPDGASAVVIATADNWPDALGGASLAGAAGGPVLLVRKDVLPQVIVDEVMRLGAQRIYLLGGYGAISRAVEDALEDLEPGKDNVWRIAGDDRYETARKVAAECVALLDDSYDGTAFVATGEKFPDALGAAPLAAAEGWPVYLVDPRKGADSALITAMRSAGVERVIVLGGTGAVPEAAKIDIAAQVPCVTDRWWGPDRYATAAEVAARSVDEGLSWDGCGIATGENFPDALAAGPVLGKTGSVLLLTRTASLPEPTRLVLTANRLDIASVRFFGGYGAVKREVRDEVLAATK